MCGKSRSLAGFAQALGVGLSRHRIRVAFPDHIVPQLELDIRRWAGTPAPFLEPLLCRLPGVATGGILLLRLCRAYDGLRLFGRGARGPEAGQLLALPGVPSLVAWLAKAVCPHGRMQIMMSSC